MAGVRPDLPHGFLGPQGNFKELGLSLMSHPDAEVKAKDNHLIIQLRSASHVKFSYHLINCRTGKELEEFCFGQIKDGIIYCFVQLPDTDWYKLQLFAAPNRNKLLPNVYNYVISCKNVNYEVHPFPTRFPEWNEGCYIYEPMVLHSDSNLTDLKWHVNVPRAKDVAILVNEEWFHLTHRAGPEWLGTFSWDKFRGTDQKVELCVTYHEGKERQFVTLLEYKI